MHPSIRSWPTKWSGVWFVCVKSQNPTDAHIITKRAVYQSWPTIHSCKSNLVSSRRVLSCCHVWEREWYHFADTMTEKTANPLMEHSERVWILKVSISSYYGMDLETELNPLELIMIAVVVIAKNYHRFNSLKLISTWSKTGKGGQGASWRPRRQKSGLTKYPLQLALLVWRTVQTCKRTWRLTNCRSFGTTYPLLEWFNSLHDSTLAVVGRTFLHSTAAPLIRKITSVGRCPKYQLSQVLAEFRTNHSCSMRPSTEILKLECNIHMVSFGLYENRIEKPLCDLLPTVQCYWITGKWDYNI